MAYRLSRTDWTCVTSLIAASGNLIDAVLASCWGVTSHMNSVLSVLSSSQYEIIH
jgi:hypothetical protein